MTGIIRRIDDLGRIVIPKSIREQIGGAPEGTKFKMNVVGDNIIIGKVKDTENFIKDIHTLKYTLIISDIREEISENSIEKINKKLDEIIDIIKTECGEEIVYES